MDIQLISGEISMKKIFCSVLPAILVLIFISTIISAQDFEPRPEGQRPEFIHGENRGPRPPQNMPQMKKEMDQQRKQFEKCLEARKLLNIEVELPEEYSNLIKLQKDNPREFQEKLMMLTRKLEEKQQQEVRKFNELIEKYRKTKSDEDKAAIRKQLEIEFSQKMTLQRKRVEKLGENYEKAKAALAKRETGKDEIINDRLKQITSDPDLKW